MSDMVNLIALTSGMGQLAGKSAQEVITYVARVSNPNNQLNFDTASGLLRYCIKNKHWSIFEHATITLEINTNRGIAAQILRHRSFCFQEFSQRYSKLDLLADSIPIPDLRRQDTKNRQNSIDDLNAEDVIRARSMIHNLFCHAMAVYNDLGEKYGIANECARFVLPLATPTRIYMTGNLRNWIHYIALREKNGTQKEHQLIAKECKKIISELFPDVAAALGGPDVEWLPEPVPQAPVSLPKVKQHGFLHHTRKALGALLRGHLRG